MYVNDSVCTIDWYIEIDVLETGSTLHVFIKCLVFFIIIFRLKKTEYALKMYQCKTTTIHAVFWRKTAYRQVPLLKIWLIWKHVVAVQISQWWIFLPRKWAHLFRYPGQAGWYFRKRVTNLFQIFLSRGGSESGPDCPKKIELAHGKQYGGEQR